MALSRTPPAPASTRPPSGYTRVSAAQQVSAAIAAILAAAEIAILQALASAVLALLAGTVLQSLITRRLQSAVTAVLMQARADVSAQLSLASRAVRQDVQAVIGADLGPLARLLPLIPAPSLARLAGDLRNADLTAAESVMLAWRRIARRIGDLEGPPARAAAQSLLDDLAGSGIRAFTDRAGRHWSLSGYGTAASAGAVGREHADMQLSAYRDAGIGLVIVVRKDPSPPCPRCAPYVGRVLSLAGQTGTVTASDASGNLHTTAIAATVAQARAAGLLHPNCFPADVLVSAPSGIGAAHSRWYEGDVVVIHTSGGNELPVTPNHPVLTPEGWVAAGDLKVGQRVLCGNLRDERVDSPLAAMRPDDEQVPARIGDVFDALRKARGVAAIRVPGSPEQFHGDGGNSDVDVVLANGLLRHDVLAGSLEDLGNGEFVGRGTDTGLLSSFGGRDESGLSGRSTANGVVGAGGQGLSLGWRHPRKATPHGFAGADLRAALLNPALDARLVDPDGCRDLSLSFTGLITPDDLLNLCCAKSALAGGYASFGEFAPDSSSSDSELGSDLGRGLPGQISPHDIVGLGRRKIAAHVYNLQTGSGLYTANGIVVHNCRDSLSPFAAGADLSGEIPHGPAWIAAQDRRYRAEQEQRRLERAIRTAQRQQAVALTPLARTQAGRLVRHLRDSAR